jgi:putative nucleotidyltransferase with HDIG domain
MAEIDANETRGAYAPPPVEVKAAVEALLGRDDPGLPMLPETALSVMRVCRDPDADPRELAALVQRDPQIAARVTRMANSAAFASVAPILSLPQAISRLGFSRVSEIALVVACQSRLFDVPGHEARLRVLMRHSALAGGFCREIARTMRRNVEEAFLAGLLHDIGKPLVLQAAVDAAAEADQLLESAQIDGLMARYHALAGARLIESWGLGSELAAVVATHHAEPHESGGDASWHQLRMADDLARHLAEEPEADAATLRSHFASHSSVEPLNLYLDDLESILRRLDDVKEFAELLG